MDHLEDLGQVSSDPPSHEHEDLIDAQGRRSVDESNPLPTGEEGASELPHSAKAADEVNISQHAPESPSDKSSQSGGSSHMSPDTISRIEFTEALQTVGDGLEELNSTMKDLLSVSDSETSGSDYSGSGVETRFSFHRLRRRIRERRRRRLEEQKPVSVAVDNTSDTARKDVEETPYEIILGTRECNFDQFQSRPATADHKMHCVDVLIAGDSLDDDIRAFEREEALATSGSKVPSELRSATQKRGGVDPDIGDVIQKEWIRRIRINSTSVMKILQQVCHESDEFGSSPMVFHRPFKILVSKFEDMKARLVGMNEPRPSSEPDATEDESDSRAGFGRADSRTTDNAGLEYENCTHKAHESKNALAELAYFMEFMEDRIMPDSRKYSSASSSKADKVRHEDLWYLFRPGVYIFVPRKTLDSKYPPFYTASCSQAILQVHFTDLNARALTRGPFSKLRGSKVCQWAIHVHHIEYDGDSYGAPSIPLPILPFRGEQKVIDLDFYPISYLEDDQIMAQAVLDGATLVSLNDRRFAYFSGWTLTTDPYGNAIRDQEGEASTNRPQHVESDIIVDYEQTFNAIPAWKQNYWRAIEWKDCVSETANVNCQWKFSTIREVDDTGHAMYRSLDRFIDLDSTELAEFNVFVQEDEFGFLKAGQEKKTPTGQMLALLPRQFFAYSMLERKFFTLDVRGIRSLGLGARDKAFESLEIKKEYKTLILSLVKSHFEKIDSEKRTHVEIETQDLIRGKGKGIVILLHGVPGVGKTATAEAVAQKWQKPLFPITCGDLGYTAESLEKSLSEIFRLAHHWGCILLLDEADVFITQRERHDLQRNALVSAFLRVLEYYNGVLFLTTNRAGVLDEAVKSRVHLSLRYDHLDEEQTVAIFTKNIQRLRDIEKQRNADPSERIVVLHREILQFARDHFNQPHENHAPESSYGRWNGRQIKNAFMIASSLTHYDDEEDVEDADKDDLAEPNVKVQKQLGRKQFEIVAETTLLYDQYREAVHSGKSEEAVAAEREERASPSQFKPRVPDRLKTPSKSFG